MCCSIFLQEQWRQMLAKILCFFHVLLSLVGFGLLVVGIHLQYKLGAFSHIIDETKYGGQMEYILIGTGVAMMVLHVTAAAICFSMIDAWTFRDSTLFKCIFFMTFGALIVIAITLIAIGAMCFTMRTVISNSFVSGMSTSMTHYKNNIESKVMLDKLQIVYGCCGPEVYTDWFLIPWISSSFVDQTSLNRTQQSGEDYLVDSVPFSCCSPTATYCVQQGLESISFPNSGLYDKGCVQAVREQILDVILGPTSATCFCLAAFQVILLIFYYNLMHSTSKSTTKGAGPTTDRQSSRRSENHDNQKMTEEGRNFSAHRSHRLLESDQSGSERDMDIGSDSEGGMDSDRGHTSIYSMGYDHRSHTGYQHPESYQIVPDPQKHSSVHGMDLDGYGHHIDQEHLHHGELSFHGVDHDPYIHQMNQDDLHHGDYTPAPHPNAHEGMLDTQHRMGYPHDHGHMDNNNPVVPGLFKHLGMGGGHESHNEMNHDHHSVESMDHGHDHHNHESEKHPKENKHKKEKNKEDKKDTKEQKDKDKKDKKEKKDKDKKDKKEKKDNDKKDKKEKKDKDKNDKKEKKDKDKNDKKDKKDKEKPDKKDNKDKKEKKKKEKKEKKDKEKPDKKDKKDKTEKKKEKKEKKEKKDDKDKKIKKEKKDDKEKDNKKEKKVKVKKEKKPKTSKKKTDKKKTNNKKKDNKKKTDKKKKDNKKKTDQKKKDNKKKTDKKKKDNKLKDATKKKNKEQMKAKKAKAKMEKKKKAKNMKQKKAKAKKMKAKKMKPKKVKAKKIKTKKPKTMKSRKTPKRAKTKRRR